MKKLHFEMHRTTYNFALLSPDTFSEFEGEKILPVDAFSKNNLRQ